MPVRKFSFDPTKKKAPRSVYTRLGFKSSASEELVKGTRAGLKVTAFDVLIKELAIQRNVGLKLVGISAKTLERRGKTKHLTPDESGRIYRVASVLEAATKLFEGNEELAKKWLKEPSKALCGDAPLDHLDTEAGADEVKDLIGKLEHGVIV
jgi:putative toxin-antitoxin system antitoxin component (TIGR02293 family)